jgi:tetratricopeptide (TPR) repeat protein
MTKKTNTHEFYDLADRYMKEKRYDDAIELYIQLRETNPDDDSILLSLAWAYRDSGRTADAIACFEKLFQKELTRKVFTGFAFDEMVRIFREEGDHDQVVELCERAVHAQPRDQALLNTLGEACLRAGKTERAIDVFKLLTRMEPDSPIFFCYLGNAHVAAGQFDAADEAYAQAVEIEPTDAHTFYNKLSNAYDQAGQYERAENVARNVIDAINDKPLYHCNLGDILARQGKLAEAEQAYENAIVLDPSFRGAYYNRLAHTLAQSGYGAEAIEMYEKAIHADPSNRFYYISLIDICRAEGLTEKAREVHEKARSLKILS